MDIVTDDIKAQLVLCGLTKTQIKSKAVKTTIELLMEQNGLLSDAAKELVEGADQAKREYEQAKEEEVILSTKYSGLVDKYRSDKRELDELRSKMLELETAQARDKVRLAEIFKKSARDMYKWDDSYVIEAYGAILAGSC